MQKDTKFVWSSSMLKRLSCHREKEERNYKVKMSAKSKLVLLQKHIQNPIKYLRGAFCESSLQLKAVNYFCKTLHLRCLTGF